MAPTSLGCRGMGTEIGAVLWGDESDPDCIVEAAATVLIFG